MNKKEQILYAALDVFAKQGLEKGKIADIAKQAGIGKGTVYEYFKSKDEIFKAIELMFIGESMGQIKQLAESDDSPTEKIEALVSILKPYGIQEIARTGRVSISRGISRTGGILNG